MVAERMNPVVKTALLCDYALTSEDGKLSIMGIFGNINFATLPSAYPRFFVVMILTLESGTHPINLGIVDPIGNQLVPEPAPVPVEVEMGGGDTNLVVGFDNMPFERAGIYQVQLFYEGRLIYSIPLNVQATGTEGFAPTRPN